MTNLRGSIWTFLSRVVFAAGLGACVAIGTMAFMLRVGL